MAETRDTSLCGTCRHTPGCAFHQDHEFTVFHCEEFEFEEAPLRAIAKRVRPAANSEGEKNPARGGKSGYPGLCGDCENGPGCMFAKPEAGVWHCEEYR